MIKKWLFFVLLNGFAFQAVAQEKDAVSVKFNLRFGSENFKANTNYISKNNDTLQINTFKCYVSAIQLQYADGSLEKNSESHLLDIENRETLQFKVAGNSRKILSKIIFNIGVDSIKSVSGALSGDLDPTKGMYWAWQSGYINMKMEGKSHSCKTRKNEFEFHIGGYAKPNYALREVTLVAKDNHSEITIDLAEFFSKIKLSQTNSIMIPSKKAMELADYSVNMFRIE